MKAFFKVIAVLMSVVLPLTQTACVTAALLKIGEDRKATWPVEQPVGYIGTKRDGHFVALRYDTTVDSEGNRHPDASNIRVDLASAYWQNLTAVPMDPYCTPAMWQRLDPNAEEQPPAPLILNRSNDYRQIIAMHKQHATGFPPMTVQVSGLNAWVVCGAGDAIGYTEAPTPPPPQPGTEGGRTAGEIALIVILFPFALAVDVIGAVFYIAVCISGSRCL